MLKLTLLAILSLSIGLFSTGCGAIKNMNRTDKAHYITTGIVNLEEKFNQVKEDMTMGEVLNLGLDPQAQNANKLPGSDGSKFIYGTNDIRPSINSPEDYKKHALELQKFETWVFPEIRLKTREKDNFWGSKKKSQTTGPERLYVIVFYEGRVLFTKDPETTKAESKSEKKSVVGNWLKSLFYMGLKYGR